MSSCEVRICQPFFFKLGHAINATAEPVHIWLALPVQPVRRRLAW